MARLDAILPAVAAHLPKPGTAASTYLVALCLAAPHLLYGYIWFFPASWRSRFKQRSVFVFDCTAWVLKGAPHAGASAPGSRLHAARRRKCGAG